MGVMERESTPTHKPTDREMVGELAMESTPTDDPTGESDQRDSNSTTVKEMPTQSTNGPTALEPDSCAASREQREN